MYTIRFPRGEDIGLHLIKSNINHRIFVKKIQKTLSYGQVNPIHGRVHDLDEIMYINNEPIPHEFTIGHITTYLKYPPDSTPIPITFKPSENTSLLDALTTT